MTISSALTNSMRFHAVTRTPGAWRTELQLAARAVANAAQKPIWLAHSGGFESEVMARAFVEEGVTFSCFTLEFSNGANKLDVGRAKAWCYAWGIPHKIVPLDVDAFFKTDVPTFVAKGYEAGSPYRYLQLLLMQIVSSWNGYAVIGRGKYGFIWHEDTDDLRIEFRSSFLTPFRWCEQNNVSHQPYFFMSTPELALSYLRIPVIETATASAESFKNPQNNEALRRFAFQSVWSDVESRPPFLGFEDEHVRMHEAKSLIRKTFPHWNTDKDIPLETALIQLES